MIYAIAKNSSKFLDFKVFYKKAFKLLLTKAKTCKDCSVQNSIIKNLFDNLLSVSREEPLSLPELPSMNKTRLFYNTGTFHQIFNCGIFNKKLFKRL